MIRFNSLPLEENPMRACFSILFSMVGLAVSSSASAAGATPGEVESRFADVNGLRMHYLQAGSQGSAVILIHGYAQNSHMWRPLMIELGKTHRVIAPDL